MKVSNTASKRKISLHSHLPIPIQVASCSKGQLISETIFLCLNSSKKQKQYLKFFALATRAEVFRYFFGRIKIKIICFWNYLTFSCPTAQAWPNFLGLAASTVVAWCYPGRGVSNKIKCVNHHQNKSHWNFSVAPTSLFQWSFLQNSLEFFEKNSAQKIWSNKDKGIKMPCPVPDRIKVTSVLSEKIA